MGVQNYENVNHIIAFKIQNEYNISLYVNIIRNYLSTLCVPFSTELLLSVSSE